MISDHDVLHLKNLYQYKNTKQFSDDIDYLLKHYQPIDLHELLITIENSQQFSRRSFLLTFDDGFRELYDVVAPILLRKGVPAVFFVNSAFVDNKDLYYLHKASIIVEFLKNEPTSSVTNKINGLLGNIGVSNASIFDAILSVNYNDREVVDEIAECLGVDLKYYLSSIKPYLDSRQIENLIRKGFFFGAHSIDHPLYRSIPLEEQIRQTLQSVLWVKNEFSVDYGAFAFPHSDTGVTDIFFDKIRESGNVDVFFGTGGLRNSSLSDRLQRFSLEKSILPARRIIAYQYLRGLKSSML